MSARLLLPASLVTFALALVLASCGGGTSSSTRETEMREAHPGPGKTFLPDVSGSALVRPATYRFSVDGDLVGKGLDWHGWGEAKATAFGKLEERSAGGLVDTFSGSVTASAPRRCKGATYYTRVIAHLPAQAPFVPTEPTTLSTPCD